MTRAERHYTLLYRSENPNRPILDCYWSARRHIHSMETLKASIADHKKRSKAAKKGWKTWKAAHS